MSFAIIPNHPPFVNTFFHLFSLFLSSLFNLSACCLFLSPNFASLSGRCFTFIYTISCFSALFSLLFSISCYFFFYLFFILFSVFVAFSVEFGGFWGELGLGVCLVGWLWSGVSSDFK